MSLEAVIFDYDGVLVELDRDKVVSLFQGRSPVSVKEAHRRWERWCTVHAGEGRPAVEMWRAFWRALAAEVGMSERALGEICEVDPLSLFRLCPDTMGALREARQLGLRIGVLSNSALPGLMSPSAPVALSEVVDVIRVPRPGIAVKPQREAYLEIAGSLGVPPGRCLYFDNEPGFVQAARDVGMRAYLVARGAGPAAGELAVVKDLSSLPTLAQAGAELTRSLT
jgi:FMN phosphatase YigB (HAD superfamily)